MRIIPGLLCGLLLVGCGSADKPETNLPLAERYTVTVGPYQQDCVGVAPMRCLVVDGSFFYQSIEGFDFVPGYQYQLLIEREQRFTPETVPADASLYHYRLVEVIAADKVAVDDQI
ncbi:DUF4377 domain-containing protein [Alkalimonas sp. NCh-2]|uniref:DUF4377 domain-containing protein n=1 Tax=Alkalimonas sp. NCh-2 TaxID=3144846 RepID=UPI0031F6DE73